MSYLGENIPKLGFGLMRLPHLEDGAPDIEQVKKMVDTFIEAGGTYFDTARVYGDSEEVTRQALVERYPRESYQLASKNFAAAAKNAEEARAAFDTSLKKTGAGYFDFYLLHNLGEARTAKYEEYDMWNFVKQLKADGKVKYIGFSFHDTAEVLEPILQAHPEAEFVQLQINYADWESENVESRKCYELCLKYGKPVVIMEPIKGGTLADPPEAVRSILKAADASMTPAQWALDFCLGLENVITVLSGMSTLEQMQQNIQTWKNFTPLTEAHMAAVVQAQKKLAEVIYVPCTACKYCLPECSQHINISSIFEALNRAKIYGAAVGQNWYDFATGNGIHASDCIECGKCETVCPQKIDIIDKVADAADLFEARNNAAVDREIERRDGDGFQRTGAQTLCLQEV